MLQNCTFITSCLYVLTVVLGLGSGYSFASQKTNAPFELSGTMWDSAAEGTGINPELLYAIALQESRKLNRNGLAAPDPFVIRYGSHVERFSNYFSAKTYLDKLISKPDINLKRLDIGLMQMNAGWHSHRVEELGDFLVPGIAIHAAANLLAEISEHTKDPVSRLGRYHSYTPELTYKYGSSVQGIYCRLIEDRDLSICGGIYGRQ